MKQKTVSKEVSIKEASDEQLQGLIRRLRNETEVQDLIRRLRVSSKDRQPYDEMTGVVPEYDKGIDLSTPVKDLYHFGIKGQKWGVRRGRNVANKHGSATKTQSGKDLSDTELRNRINRIQMEKTYAQLTAPQKSPGKAYVQGLLKSAGNEIAKDFVTSVLKTATKGTKAKAISKLEKSLRK